MFITRKIIFFYIVSSIIDLIAFSLEKIRLEGSSLYLLILGKFFPMFTIAVTMAIVFFWKKKENINKKWRELQNKVEKSIPYFVWFFETIIFINLELRSLMKFKQVLSIFLRTIFFSIKLLKVSGIRLTCNSWIITFFIFIFFVNLSEIIIEFKENLIFDLILFICNSSFIYFISLFCDAGKLTEYKSLKKKLIHQIYEHYFLSESKPFLIIEKTKNNSQKLILIDENAKEFFGLQNTNSTVNFDDLNAKYQKKVIAYQEITKLKSDLSIRQIEKLTEVNIIKPKKDLINLLNFSKTDESRNNLMIYDVYLKNENEEIIHYQFDIIKIILNKKKYYNIILNDMKLSDELKNFRSLNDKNHRLFSSFSHELKTPLNGALPNLEFVQTFVNNDESKILLNNSIGSLKLLENTLSNIIDYYLFETNQIFLNRKEFILEDLMNEVQEILFPMIKIKRLELSIKACPKKLFKLKISTDYIRLRQIFLNLLMNAIQFTIKGEIKISIAYAKYDQGKLEFFIEDTGIGIEKEKLKNIKKKLKDPEVDDLDINSTGSCLGLIICENLSVLLGSHEGLNIESKVDEGSVVSFKIDNVMNFQAYIEKSEDVFSTLSNQPKHQNKKIDSLMKYSSIVEEKKKLYLYENKNKKNTLSIDEAHEWKTLKSNINNNNTFVLTNSFDTLNKVNLEEKLHLLYDFSVLPKFLEVEKISSQRFVIDYGEEIEKKEEDDKSDESFSLKIGSMCRKISLEKPSLALNIESICQCEEVLCVDDDAFNLLSLELILRSFNIRCYKAMNGIEAITLLTSKSSCDAQLCRKFKLIFMDYQMPIMDGIETTKSILNLIKKAEIKDTIIIGCTAFVSKDDVLKCYDAGMKEVIYKPLNKNIIKSVLLEWYYEE